MKDYFESTAFKYHSAIIINCTRSYGTDYKKKNLYENRLFFLLFFMEILGGKVNNCLPLLLGDAKLGHVVNQYPNLG